MGHKTEENMGAGESSSNNNITGPVPIRVQDANPLLYTLAQDHMNIQPYWIMILQLIAKDIILQRIWNRIRYKTWSTTQEIAIGRLVLELQTEKYREARNFAAIGQVIMELGLTTTTLKPTRRLSTTKQRSKHKDVATHPTNSHNIETPDLLLRFFRSAVVVLQIHIEGSEEKINEYYRKLKFDSFDFIAHSLPLLGHAIWYCYIQSSCMHAQYATTWNCYNAFGYRLYNYIFVSYCSFFWLVMTKGFVYHTLREEHKMVTNSLLVNIEFYLGLSASLVTVVFVGCLIFPYLLTNVIPMAAAYTFMIITYIQFWICALVFCGIISVIPIFDRLVLGIVKRLDKEHRPLMGLLIMYPFTILTFPILLSIFYNYSQYIYYGDDYYGAMADEY
ncbi:unnamed protein product, partial [Adineta steineri]